MKLKNKLINLSAISAFCLTGLAGVATAEETFDQAEFDLDMKALPELADDLQNTISNKSASPRMQCYIDTAAYDLFSDNCAAFGFVHTTSAVFRIDSVPSNFTIMWSNSRCNSQSAWCVLPISLYQQIDLSATVLNHSNNTFSTVSSTAEYIGWWQ
ncbi:MAG: hypothetical protein L3J52_05170 [Proteobacteria bacterium]|nr:hypothetical protein [Pseudomonadota bacterium]